MDFSEPLGHPRKTREATVSARGGWCVVTSHEESDDPARAGTPATAPPTPGTGGLAEGSTPHAQHPALGLCPSGGRVGLRV